MTWWGRLLGGSSGSAPGPRRVNYLQEAMALEKQGDFDSALTSYRLALRDQPRNPDILVNIAIAYSRTGRLEDAIRSYRQALDITPDQPGAHYGLAFLLLKRGDRDGARLHLTSFLATPMADGMAQWESHAREVLARLDGADGGASPAAEPAS